MIRQLYIYIGQPSPSMIIGNLPLTLKPKSRDMEAIQKSPSMFPIPPHQALLPPKITHDSKISPLTPFSAVAPARLLGISRLKVQSTLETIEEEEIVEDCFEASDTCKEETADHCFESSITTPASFLSARSTCSFDMQKSLASYGGHNCQCA
ncbi:unnamed protein product [Ilex paraguariensis]|uniref:Uncharacterized protein n=2 Tax=Ilex paraguariensis TaxID=185542 RepID=A0ABC8S475_9AQUA